MWTDLIVRARFLEAADVERRMVVKGEGGGGNAWPAYYYDAEDRAGWDDQAIQDNLERWQGRKITKSNELTRWEEVFFEWTKLIPPQRRLLIWRFAQCLVAKQSFSEWCRRKGINRSTAYNRVEKVFRDLATVFGNEGRLLRMPDERWCGHSAQEDVPIKPQAEKSASANGKKKYAFLADKPTDTLKTPAAIASFVEHLEEVNSQRRKALARRLGREVVDAA